MDERYVRAYARGFFDGKLGCYKEGYTQDRMQRVMPGCSFARCEQAAYRDGWIEGRNSRLHGGI